MQGFYKFPQSKICQPQTNLYGFSNPQNEQRGTINEPVKLMLPSAISSTNQPTWYVTVEYTLLNQNVWRNNPDQTLT